MILDLFDVPKAMDKNKYNTTQQISSNKNKQLNVNIGTIPKGYNHSVMEF